LAERINAEANMRTILAILLWLVDVMLKVGAGFLIVLVIWLPFACMAGASFSIGWVVAGGIAGACVNGFFEGCDLILLGLAKRVAVPNKPQAQSGAPPGGSGSE
jgi:hypothetical protein